MKTRAVVPLVLILGLFARAEESIFWLSADEAEQAAERLSGIPEGERDAAAWTMLGWSHLLYANDADTAIESFRRATQADPKSGDAWEGLHAAATSRLSGDLAAEAVEGLIRSEPDSIRTEALLRVGRVQDNQFSVRPIPKRIAFAEEILAATKNPFTQLALRQWLTDLYQTQLRTEKAWETWKAQGQVTSWRACGFFGATGAACFDDALPPEREYKPTAEYPVLREAARWAAVEFRPGDIDPSAATRGFLNRGTTFYMRAVLDSPAEREAFARLSTTMSARVWLNGVEVGVHDLMRTDIAQESWFGITLSRGQNVLLLKFTAPGYFYGFDVTIHHADGRAMTDLANPSPEAGPDVKPSGREARGGSVEDARAILARKVVPLESATLREALLTVQLLQTVGLPEQARTLMQAVYDRAPGSAYVQFFQAAVIAADRLLPPARRMNIARTHHERAVALDPRFAPALLSLARTRAGEDADRAVEDLQRLLEVNPGCADAWSALAGIYQKRGWAAERRLALERAAAAEPGDPARLAELIRLHAENLNYPAAFQAIARLKSEQGYEAYWEEIALLGAAGRDEEQAAALETYRRRFPGNGGVPVQLAAVRERQGSLEAAEALLKEAVALWPREGEPVQRLLAFYIGQGQTEAARAVMDLILAEPARLGAYDEATRRYLDHLAGVEDDWQAPWDVDAPALVKAAEARQIGAGQTHSVVLLDQRLVRFIGRDLKWREEETHRIVKILSKSGGEKYGQLFLGGGDWARFRLRELRVFTPDGRVLEMDAVQEEGRWRMPELDTGSVLEYRVTRGGGPIGEGQLVFSAEQSPTFRLANEPVLWSRTVVLVPEGARLEPDLRNVSAPEITKSGASIVYTWDSRDLAEWDPEPFMPPATDLLPNVRFIGGSPSFPQLIENLRSRALGVPIAADVRAKAAELTTGLRSDEEKARAIYAFVVTRIKPGGNSLPSHVLADGEGRPDELFRSLCASAGLKLLAAFARAPQGAVLDHDPKLQVPPYVNAIYLLRLDSGDLWLWPSRWNAWGSLPNQLYGGEAIVVEGRTMFFRALPEKAPEDKAIRTHLRVDLTAEAVADISGEFRFTEGRAAAVRQQLEQVLGQDRFRMIVQNMANQMFPGITVKESGVTEFDMDSPAVAVTFSGTSTRIAQRKSGTNRITFRAVAPPLKLSENLIRTPDRRFPMRTSFADNLTTFTEIRVTLPEFTSIQVPEGLLLANEAASYSLSYRLEGRTLTVTRRVVGIQTDLSPERSRVFAEMCKLIDDVEKRSVSLVVKEGEEE